MGEHVADKVIEANKMICSILGPELNTGGVEGLVRRYVKLDEGDRELLFALLALIVNQQSSSLWEALIRGGDVFERKHFGVSCPR